MNTKKCSYCKQTLPVAKFSACGKGRDRLCKECRRAEWKRRARRQQSHSREHLSKIRFNDMQIRALQQMVAARRPDIVVAANAMMRGVLSTDYTDGNTD